jgi:lysozyme family protein
MTAANFDPCLGLLLVHEGGYSDHPSDPGGPTKFGITIGDYRKYAKPGATPDDIRTMRVEEARAIYKTNYWSAQRCDALPPGLDYTIFDYGVNSGIGRSGKVLRRILGLPDNTATVNDDVLRAVAKRDLRSLIAAVNDERLAFLKGLKTWPVFGNGWNRRVAEVRAAALRMAGAAPVPAEAPPPNRGGRKTAAAAIAASGAVVAQLMHTVGAQPAIVAAILIVAILLALGGWITWRWLQRSRQRPN